MRKVKGLKRRRRGIETERNMESAAARRLLLVAVLLLAAYCILPTVFIYAQANAAATSHAVSAPAAAVANTPTTTNATKKNIELMEKEEALKKEEVELKALRKDVEEKIEKYIKLLGDIEAAIERIETSRDVAMEHVIKAYESMSSEDAASRLSALDESTAIKIILKMKSKKAGAIIALMETKKAASITEGIASIVKKIPTK